MQYFLNVKENTVLSFSMNAFKANGHIEYMDKSYPKGLIKLNFAVSKIDVEEMRLVAERDYTKVPEARLAEVFATFDQIAEDLVKKGILTDTSIIVGMCFYYNADLGIPTQIIRRYLMPDGKFTYSFSNNGSTRNVNMRPNSHKPHHHVENKPKQNKKPYKPTFRKNEEQRSEPAKVIGDENPDDFGNRLKNNADAYVDLSGIGDMTYTTDTGISEIVEEGTYQKAAEGEVAVIPAEEVSGIEKALG